MTSLSVQSPPTGSVCLGQSLVTVSLRDTYRKESFVTVSLRDTCIKESYVTVSLRDTFRKESQ